MHPKPRYVERCLLKKPRYTRMVVRRKRSHSTGGMLMVIMGHHYFRGMHGPSPFRRYQMPLSNFVLRMRRQRRLVNSWSTFFMCTSRLDRAALGGRDFLSVTNFPTSVVVPPPDNENDGRPDGQSRMAKLVAMLYSELSFARDPIYRFP